MFSPEQYQLLDFGDGRKLERFGPVVLDRPSPAAGGFRPARNDAWESAAARFEKSGDSAGHWIERSPLPAAWSIEHDRVTFELKATEFGHVGLFAEQAENWDWIARLMAAANRPLNVLNLFAYTGGSTLAAAAAGASVTHVDSAKNTVAWARRNAQRSGLADAPIRWITEDAARFVQRELRRENRYDAIVLDPPSYGHGPKREVWKLSKDLAPLLQICRKLLTDKPAFFLLTCHTPEFSSDNLNQLIRQIGIAQEHNEIQSHPLFITATDGRRLPSGVMVRWSKSLHLR